jgi:hypothetical protein
MRRYSIKALVRKTIVYRGAVATRTDAVRDATARIGDSKLAAWMAMHAPAPTPREVKLLPRFTPND